ncbi:MAG: leucine-rich repeat domain-containing protein, partial [Firmicutes bacterium]|nr:leucine-rich repeat domain-containing protein [Bacillota bacterium]
MQIRVKIFKVSVMALCVFSLLLSSIFVAPIRKSLYAYEAHDDVVRYVVGSTSVTAVGLVNPFYNGDVVIPATFDGLPVTEVANEAFYGSLITGITVGENISRVGDWAFAYTENLIKIVWNSQVPRSQFIMMSIHRHPFSFINNITYENYNDGTADVVSISFGEGVVSIPDWLFIPQPGINVQGTTIVIPDSVQTIGSGSFNRLYGVFNLKLGEGVTLIRDQAFYGCAIPEIIIPDSVIEIQNDAFAYNPVATYLRIGANVNTIRAAAFIGLRTLKVLQYDAIMVTNTFDMTPRHQFAGMGVGVTDGFKLNIGEGVVEIPNNFLFYTSNWYDRISYNSELVLPNSLKHIGNNAFCRMSNGAEFSGDLVIPDGVQTIGSNAFSDHPFSTIALGTGVTAIAERAFWGIRNPVHIVFTTEVPPMMYGNPFINNNTLVAMYVPSGTGDAYRAAPGYAIAGYAPKIIEMERNQCVVLYNNLQGLINP